MNWILIIGFLPLIVFALYLAELSESISDSYQLWKKIKSNGGYMLVTTDKTELKPYSKGEYDFYNLIGTATIPSKEEIKKYKLELL